MYVPSLFQENDPERLLRVMREHPFATLVSPSSDGPVITHVPLLADHAADGGFRLLGHIAKANPHSALLESGTESIAVFHGPQLYVSPRWYAQPGNVPTWNYISVHATG